MAERSFQPSNIVSDPAQDAGLDIKGITNVAGAVLSLALLTGVGVWSYNLMVRDVSGVPVVRAAEGPIRVQPDSPGGKQAAHQGLSVNNVAAVGEAGRPADRLILAPPPLSLTAEDTPAQAVKSETQPPVEAPSDVSPRAEEDDAVPAETSAAQLAGFSRAESSGTVQSQSSQTGLEGAERSDGGLARSLRPKLRPEGLGAGGATTEVQLASLEPVDPNSVAPGTGLAQLGSFDNEALARDAWITLSAQFSTYLNGKQQVIQSAESGGRRFYRLRALGFEDISDARRFCSALVAEGAECIPVISR